MTSFPPRSVGFFSFLFSMFSLRSQQFLCVSWNPGNAASSRCWCALVQDPMVWGARLSSQEGRRLARPLHSDSLPEYTQIREEATGKKGEEKGPRVAQRGPKGNSGPVSSHIDSTLSLDIKWTRWLKLHPHFSLWSLWSTGSDSLAAVLEAGYCAVRWEKSLQVVACWTGKG